MEKTLWLESPVRDARQSLKIPCELELEPYYGRPRQKRLWHTQYTIGSDPNCDIVLDDPFVSKRHAELYLAEKQQYAIRSLSNRNGIFVNGTRVSDAYLTLGSTIKLGRSFLRFPRSEKNDVAQQSNEIFYASAEFKQLIREVETLALSECSVLLTGETGTGKEVLARRLHNQSPRKNAPFISVNCASLSGGLVNSELFGHKRGSFTGADSNRIGAILSAHRGTLFLDEFGDLPLATQAILLRVLETKEVKAIGADSSQKSDFRLIVATSLSVERALELGELRSDLFYRVADAWIKIPPLRERREDISAIIEGVIRQDALQIEGEAKAILEQHEWPGNVRELNSVLARAKAKTRARGTEIILEEDILLHSRGGNLGTTNVLEIRSLKEMEEKLIRAALRRNGGQRQQAAKELGIARSTLFEKLKKYRIQ